MPRVERDPPRARVPAPQGDEQDADRQFCTGLDDVGQADAKAKQQGAEHQQDQATVTRGAIARNLVDMYRALGGGWQMRAGRDFVPDATKEVMAERTDWGKLLKREALDVPEPGQPREKTPSPDW